MANLKLIKVTGSPFCTTFYGCIGIQVIDNQFQIIKDGRLRGQSSLSGTGWKYATAEEIEESWDAIYPHWTPEHGDKVIVTQDYPGWTNCKGTIIEKDSTGTDYYRVEREDGSMSTFDYTSQMILAPYVEVKAKAKLEVEPQHIFEPKPTWSWKDLKIGDKVKIIGQTSSLRPIGSIFTIDKMEHKDYTGNQPIRLIGTDGKDKGWPTIGTFEPYYEPKEPKEETVSIRFLREQEFKDQGLWTRDHPKGWNSDGHMNGYLGQSVVIPKSSIGSDGTFRYETWTFKVTDYLVTEGVSSSESVSKSVVTPIAKPEKPPRRFKVGDKVTYKSRAECNGSYNYGGEDQTGFVGIVESEMSYESDKGCYGLRVTTKGGDYCYNMLESEFHEYDFGFKNTTG